VSLPGGCTTAPRGVCIKCNTGTLEVTVFQKLVCWDTEEAFGWEAGGHRDEKPLAGATVTYNCEKRDPSVTAALVNRPPTPPLTTDADGKVVFSQLIPGEYTVTASKDGFIVVPPEKPGPLPVVKKGKTATAEQRLKSDSLECDRRHTPKKSGMPDLDTIWWPIFWGSEPWVLVLRDILWLMLLALSAVGFATAPSGGAAMGALGLAFAAFLTTVIFGQVLGIVTMVAAFAIFAVVVVMATGVAILGLPARADPVLFPALCATWAAVLIVLVNGRVTTYNKDDWTFRIVTAVIGAITAVVVFFLIAGPFDIAGSLGFGALQAVAGAAAAGLGAGMLFHSFLNEGRITADKFAPQSLLLPYGGEHYCVQGHRGWISHFKWQEFAYDFAVPEGSNILNSLEGHVIEFRESCEGNVLPFSSPQNQDANYIYVRHRDGSVAWYLHLVKGGVTTVNPVLGTLGKKDTDSDGHEYFKFEADSPVHVHQGQRLGLAGHVGISMFPHIQRQFKQKASSEKGALPVDSPYKFQDGDVARHDGRCWSMRKYRSDNVDRGPVELG